MATIDFDKLPKFSELPVKPGAPPESNWGVFGDADEIGTLNFLTEEGVLEAVKLVRKGKVFRLDTPIGYANPPLFGRRPVNHQVLSWASHGFLAFDDKFDDYNTQEGAQWDGLGHVGHKGYGAFYNGTKPEDVESGRKLGIHLWANKVVGRGVLIDLFKYRNDIGRPINPGEPEVYSRADLEGALKAQNVELKPGSIVLARTGWMQHYLNSTPEYRESISTTTGLKACGIEPSSDTAAWLWDNRVAALGTDCPAVEQWPWDPNDNGALHYRTLALLGLPIGEQFDLEALAADCVQDGVYECMVVSVPLNTRGGIASPPNAVAIK
jgi:kynurenine formamidase